VREGTPAAATGLPLRAFAPNAITAAALCFGLSGVRFAIDGNFERAILVIVVAGVLDAMDGSIARLLKANSKFGAELDSLSDNIAFGTAPAIILYLWALQEAPKFGWTVALALAVACALRLARFNARIEAEFQPHKSAGYNTGVPAPAGAGLAFTPIFLWLVTGQEVWREWWLVMPWTLFVAVLMISAVPTFSWQSIRIRRGYRVMALGGVALLVALLINAPFITLLAVSLAYVAALPFSIAGYGKVKRRRAAAALPASDGEPSPLPDDSER
jgi:CDP-diacylglycerol--serine O-phosphatidyltransferase